MKNHEFDVLTDKIRPMCDRMSDAQVKALIELLTYDMDERKRAWAQTYATVEVL